MTLIIILLSVFWPFFIHSNNVAGDFSYLSREELLLRFDIPRIWQERISEGFGQNTLAILWNWPQDLFYGFLGKFGLPFSVVEILLFLVPFIVIGYFSTSKFFRYFGVNGWAATVGSLVYLLNTYILLVIDGGQFSIALSYVLLPLTYILFLEATKDTFRKKLISALSIAALGFLDIRFLYLLGLILLMHFLYFAVLTDFKNILNHMKDWFLTSAVATLVTLLLHAYWLVPAIFVGPPSLPSGYSEVSQTTTLSFANWKHAFLLLHPNWFLNVFGKVSQIHKEFLLIPLFAIAGLLFGKAGRSKYYFIFLAIIGILLVKGTTDPIPGLYPYLFEKIPGFVMFRDPTKFYIYIALSYSFLLAGFVEYLDKKFGQKFRFGKFPVIPLIMILYLILLISPVWLGRMTGTFAKPAYQDEYTLVQKALGNDKSFGRVLWMQSQPPLGYSSEAHPSVEMSRIFKLRPFTTGIVGGYETNNFLRESPYMGELFDIAGIKYIVYPYPDTRRENLKPDNIEYYHSFLDQISTLPWIEEKLTDYPVPLLKNKGSGDRFFVAPNTYLVIGSDLIYRELINIPGFKLKDNALIFAEETPGITNGILKDFGPEVLLYNKSDIDLVSSMLPQEKFVFPSVGLPTSPGSDGWWKRDSNDFLWWRDFLQAKYGQDFTDLDYGGGYAISEGKNSLEVRNGKLKSGELLMARVMRSSKGGSIGFKENGKQIGEINPTYYECPEKRSVKLTGYGEIPDQNFEYDCAEFSWLSVGMLTTGGVLTIETEGEINVVNALVTVNLEDLKDTRPPGELNIIDVKELGDGSDVNLNAVDNRPEVTYDRISPTNYKLNVSGLIKPSTLVFSETYDKNWLLSGKEPFKVYSLFNGFRIDRDGEYELTYAPQEYVNYGLLVSAASILLIFIYLLIKKV